MPLARIRAVAGGVLAICLLWLAAQPVLAQEEITSSAGPLTRIIITPDLACQVAHRDDDQFEFYPADSELGNCGTFLAIGGTGYGRLGGPATQIQWTTV